MGGRRWKEEDVARLMSVWHRSEAERQLFMEQTGKSEAACERKYQRVLEAGRKEIERKTRQEAIAAYRRRQLAPVGHTAVPQQSGFFSCLWQRFTRLWV